jgi:hypothetical protein
MWRADGGALPGKGVLRAAILGAPVQTRLKVAPGMIKVSSEEMA